MTLRFLDGGGQVGALMRVRDWTSSPLGPPQSWPEALKTLVGVMLGSSQPMFAAWGGERIMLYNDGYAVLLQDRHPAALGAPFREVWHDIMDEIGPILDGAFDGQSTQMDDIGFQLTRDGRRQEAHFSFSYTPVRGAEGDVAGMFCACQEITEAVLAGRRAEAERERLRLMLRQMPGFAALLTGPEHRFEYVNDAYVAVAGERDFVGKTVREALPEIEGQGFLEKLDEVYATGRPYIVRSAPIRLQNEQRDRYLDFIYEPVRDDAGRVRGIFVGGYDATEGVRATRDLRESEERFRNMADHAPVMMWVTDASGRCTYLNKAWYDFTGQTEEEALGFGWLDATHPEDRPIAERSFRDANSRAEPFRIEYRLRRADGEYRWAIDAAAPRFGDQGQGFLGYVGSVIDIEERRAAERQLAEREARARAQADELNAIYAAAPIGLCVLDRDMRFIRINDRMAEINGLPAADHVGRHMREIVPDLNAQAWEAMQAVLAGSSLHGVELRGETPAQPGVKRIWRENWLPLKDANDAVSGVIVSAEEVTEERKAQADLQALNAELEERVAQALAERRLLAEMVEKTPIFVQVVGLDWRWLAINKATADEFERLYGIRPKVGDDLRIALAHDPRQQAGLEALWARAIAGEEFVATADIGAAPQRRSYEMRFYTLRDTGGPPIAAYMFATDITERLAEQQQLHEMQKLETIGQLTGGVAHDFNNLLAAILSNLDLVRKRVDDLRTAKLLDGAIQGAERGAALTKRLLAFARRQDLRSEAVSVRALFDGMRDLLERSLGPRVSILADVPPDLPEVEVDANQLELALLNLAVNARDAMPEGGSLRIEAAAETVAGSGDPAPGDYVRISISDTGMGMDADTLRRAAEPFFTTKGVGKGTGLGLPMVQGLAAQSGGALRLRSTPGVGTTVDLWLPLARRASSPAIAVAPAREPAPTRPLKIMVVDDDMLVGMGTSAMLEDLGHAVVEAASGRAALDLHASDGEIDFVVTDYSMPGMTGADLAAALAERDPKLPVLLATGYAELPSGHDAGLPRIAKPFRQEDLDAAIRAMLGSRSAETLRR